MTAPARPLADPNDDFLQPGLSAPTNNIVPGTAMARLSRAMRQAEPDGSFREDVEFYDPDSSVADIGHGVTNPYGSGLEAYEPNTVFFGQDVYAEAYNASQQSKLEEAAAQQLLTGDFSQPGGGGSDVDGVPYASIFNEAGKRYGISGSLLAAVARAESNFNPRARSPVGAQGLMQFMPGTAAGLGVNPFDVRSSIFGAAKYLKQQIDRFGSVKLGLAAYNAGPGNVSKYGGIPPFAETQAYVRRVTAFAQDYGSGPVSTTPNYSDGGIAEAGGKVARMVSAATALAARGVPYVWGGTSASGVDCSGLIYYAARAAGIDWKRYRAVDYGRMGKSVRLSEARPGDIVYYDNPGDVDHVGIYLGNGRMVQAPQSGQNVKVTGVGNYTSIRRVFNDGSFAASPSPAGPKPIYNGNNFDPYSAIKAYQFTGYGAIGVGAAAASVLPSGKNRYLATAAQAQRARNFRP